MIFQNKHYYWCWVFVSLLISHGIGVTGFMVETPSQVTKDTQTTAIIASSPSLTSLDLSSYDSEYYTPAEQPPQSANSQSQSRITLSRFLSQYVKDHPEVSAIFITSPIDICTAGL